MKKHIPTLISWILIISIIAYAPVRNFLVQVAVSLAIDALLYMFLPFFALGILVTIYRNRAAIGREIYATLKETVDMVR